MDGTPKPGVAATGQGSVAANTISGTAITGNNARIVTVKVEPGGLPSPDQVPLPGRVSNLPRSPARVFPGREAPLAQLGRVLAGDASVVVTQAVYGLGGVGKSELALHFAHTRRSRYQLVWWVTAASATQIETGLAALTTRLCPAIEVATTTGDAAGWALGWFQTHDRWLLVLDNVEDPRDVDPVVAQLPSGHIVLTTRRDVDWGRLAVPIRLDVLEPGPAAEVITARIGLTTSQDREDAAAVADELGFLPLALDQAVAYMIQTRMRPGRYLGKLRQHPARMYAATADQAEQTIARLWDITIEAIRGRDPDAIRLLQVMACYAPDNIPRVILGGTFAADEVDDQLGLLASYSMITLTTETVGIHRLVRAIVLGTQEMQSLGHSLADTALDWLNKALPADPDSNVAAWPLLRTLIPHVESITSQYPDGQQPLQLGQVHIGIGKFHRSQGEYQLALKVHETALRIYEERLGREHPDVASALGNLGLSYRDLGRAAEALPLAQRELQIAKAALGPNHPDVVSALSALAGPHKDELSKLANTYKDALSNLASTYKDLGGAAKALLLEQRALEIAEVTLGPGDPSIAIQLGNLAVTYRELGRAAEALPLELRALEVTEAALGPDHPDVAISLGNLAITHIDLGREADALPLQRRALEISEATLRPDHPSVAVRRSNLAGTYIDLGRAAEALPLVQRGLEITEAALGPDHPRVAIALGNLAVTYRKLGRAAEALPLELRALEITETALGPDHPRVASRLGNLAVTYRELGRAAEALPLELRALEITETALGPDHPSMATRLGNLALTYRELGREADALTLEQRAQQGRTGQVIHNE